MSATSSGSTTSCCDADTERGEGGCGTRGRVHLPPSTERPPRVTPSLTAPGGGSGKHTLVISRDVWSNPQRKKDPEPGICCFRFRCSRGFRGWVPWLLWVGAVAAVGHPLAWGCGSSRMTYDTFPELHKAQKYRVCGVGPGMSDPRRKPLKRGRDTVVSDETTARLLVPRPRFLGLLLLWLFRQGWEEQRALEGGVWHSLPHFPDASLALSSSQCGPARVTGSWVPTLGAAVAPGGPPGGHLQASPEIRPSGAVVSPLWHTCHSSPRTTLGSGQFSNILVLWFLRVCPSVCLYLPKMRTLFCSFLCSWCSGVWGPCGSPPQG